MIYSLIRILIADNDTLQIKYNSSEVVIILDKKQPFEF